MFSSGLKEFLGYGNLLIMLFFSFSAALPLCIDQRAPQRPGNHLTFCNSSVYSQKGCCSINDDHNLRNRLDSMKIEDAECAYYIKQILCAQCDQFAASLFRAEYKKQLSVPILCNSTSTATNYSTNGNRKSYCSQVWNACQNVSIQNSPFVSVLQNGTTNSSYTKISELWKTKKTFCTAFGGSVNDGLSCFNGTTALFNVTVNETPVEGVCLERIAQSSFINMVPHPDGSNRVFLATQAGQVWLATVPNEGSEKTLAYDISSPFLDISTQIASNAEYGLLGLAFHPNFKKNGRFFASFNCYKPQHSNCGGRCACNSDVHCDPSQLNSMFGTMPCQYFSVIAEFTANKTTSIKATASEPAEVRRIFTMGLPFSSHHGGQILFGPQDGYLYFMMGDGGEIGDPYNFAQNSRSLLGKIMRFDIDSIPSEAERKELNLWGNYSIPPDNPYAGNKNWQQEIWALGLRNPWRCSFDPLKPMYFYCGDVGQDTYEEVNLITKGGNYGWRVYEGTALYTSPDPVGGNTNPSSIQAIFPVMGYYHRDIKNDANSAAITGGFVSRSNQDPCLYGRYLFADVFGSYLWVGTENPVESGNFSSRQVPFKCSSKSPIQCTYSNQSGYPNLGYIFSFGQDNNNDLYLLAYNGVYRVVHPSNCNFKCPKVNQVNSSAPQTSPAPSPSEPNVPTSDAIRGMWSRFAMLLLAFMYLSKHL